MGYKKLVETMKLPSKRYLLNMGAGHRSFRKQFKVTREEVVNAKKEVRKWISSTEPKNNFPKILILDIETAPIKAYVWRLWKQNIAISQIMSEWFILTWSAKWLHSDLIISEKLSGNEARAEDDTRILKPLWEILNQADIIIAHNGQSFDIPKINARFFIKKFPPPAPYRQIDTKLVAQKQFNFSSNKLDALASYIGIEGKIHTTFELWDNCVNGDEDALEEMRVYNIQDVLVLEKVYLKLRPWIKNHPNVAVYIDDNAERCPMCGSTELIETSASHFTNLGKYPILKCECGAHVSSRKNILSKEKRDTLLMAR